MRRSDPNGLLVRFEVEDSTTVTRVDVGLDDGEDVLSADLRMRAPTTGQITRAGGPVYRGLVYKPVVNGTWPLVLRAYTGEPGAYTLVATTRCEAPGVTVTF